MRNKFLLFLILFLLGSNIFCYYLILNYLFFKEEVAFLNVGQGDSELIKTKIGNILIDAGPNNKILFEISKLLPFYERTIDLVIISHPNTDHFNGLFDLLEHYQIRFVLINDLNYPLSRYQNLIKELNKHKVLLLKGKKGTKISWFNNSIIIIHPDDSFNTSDINEQSLVALLNFNQNKFLFTGDIDSKVEKQLIRFFKKKIDVLKVAHHGSKVASSLEFLQTINPKVAVIEVGENKYDQPHQSVLQRLTQLGIKIFRTDLNGTIRFIFKDQKLLIKPEQL